MKTIKCDRCGKDIPYVPMWENIVNTSNVNTVAPTLKITLWDTITQKLNEVDLCDECRDAVYNYIFDYSKGSNA